MRLSESDRFSDREHERHMKIEVWRNMVIVLQVVTIFVALGFAGLALRPTTNVNINLRLRPSVESDPTGQNGPTLINKSSRSLWACLVVAAEIRDARQMRAEEQAGRLPVLLSVPLLFFLLPTMVAVLIVTADLAAYANLSQLHAKN